MCCFRGTDVEEVSIHENVQSIGCCAFEYCRKLCEITFTAGSKLKEIQKGAFSNCNSLKHIFLPENIEEIHEGCFNKSGLEEIMIPRKVKEIGGNDD